MLFFISTRILRISRNFWLSSANLIVLKKLLIFVVYYKFFLMGKYCVSNDNVPKFKSIASLNPDTFP